MSLDPSGAHLDPAVSPTEVDAPDLVSVGEQMAKIVQDAGRSRLWVPLLNGSERLGVLGLVLATEEVMRRLTHALVAHQAGKLTDDATQLLVEWRTGRSAG